MTSFVPEYGQMESFSLLETTRIVPSREMSLKQDFANHGIIHYFYDFKKAECTAGQTDKFR